MLKYDKLEKLDRTVDSIRARYGEDSIFRACFLGSNVTHMGGGLDKDRRSGVTVGIDLEKEKLGRHLPFSYHSLLSIIFSLQL